MQLIVISKRNAKGQQLMRFYKLNLIKPRLRWKKIGIKSVFCNMKMDTLN